MSDNWVALPLPVRQELRVIPNDPEMTGWEGVVGLLYNPTTNVLLALTTDGGNRWITLGEKHWHLDIHHPGGFRSAG